MARTVQNTDDIRELVEKIQHEKKKIEDALEAISEYSERLRKTSDETQQRLIGKS
jgi:methyl-accepting chemotaxis protein